MHSLDDGSESKKLKEIRIAVLKNVEIDTYLGCSNNMLTENKKFLNITTFRNKIIQSTYNQQKKRPGWN